MLFRWLIISVFVVLLLARTNLSNYLRLGHLPGDIHCMYKKIKIHLPFTSTLLIFMILYLLVRLI
jgi:hypothetical protein